jgi:hypothetical protein
MTPCVSRRECYFTEAQYVRGNRAPLRKPAPPTEDELRAEYRRHVETGRIPAPCPVCGLPHFLEKAG